MGTSGEWGKIMVEQADDPAGLEPEDTILGNPTPGRKHKFSLKRFTPAAIVLALSLAIGLVAAFGAPLAAGQKALPSTSAPKALRASVSVISASGIAQITYPGQAAESLATGILLEARPGMRVSTAQGTAKLELSNGVILFVDNATSVSIVNAAAQATGAVLALSQGGILVDATHLTHGAAALVTGPQPSQANAYGQFLGVRYDPGSSRLDADCLEGGCRLSGASASRDLATGQHSWVAGGVVGDLDDARWEAWSGLCDADCPSPALSQSIPLVTPTIAPTALVPIPTQPPELSGLASVAEGILQPPAPEPGSDGNSSVAQAPAAQPQPPAAPTPTPQPAPVNPQTNPAPTSAPAAPPAVQPTPAPTNASGAGSGNSAGPGNRHGGNGNGNGHSNPNPPGGGNSSPGHPGRGNNPPGHPGGGPGNGRHAWTGALQNWIGTFFHIP